VAKLSVIVCVYACYRYVCCVLQAMFMYVCMYVCVCVCMCVPECVCVCVFQSVCVCVYALVFYDRYSSAASKKFFFCFVFVFAFIVFSCTFVQLCLQRLCLLACVSLNHAFPRWPELPRCPPFIVNWHIIMPTHVFFLSKRCHVQ